MPDVQIRRATADDRDKLVELIARFYRVDNHEFEPSCVEAGLTPLLRDDQRGQVWVATDGATIVGYAIVTWSWSLESGGLDCILDELYVEHRGGDPGGVLMQRAGTVLRPKTPPG